MSCAPGRIGLTLIAAVGLLASGVRVSAQDRLKLVPRYARFQRIQAAEFDAVKPGVIEVEWKDGGKAFEYEWNDKRYRYDITAHRAIEVKSTARAAAPTVALAAPEGGPRPQARGRQVTTVNSPDGKWTAVYRDRNMYLRTGTGGTEIPITTDGSEKTRVKYGTASWVYGEELSQRTAFWWSPDSRKLAFYRFDESTVKDYYVPLRQLAPQDGLETEPFPIAGAPNPVVDLMVYDLASKTARRMDVRSGKPFDSSVVGQYVYGISWTRDSKELLFHRTNRRQNVMEFAAADPATGTCRIIVREEWLPSWTDNSPTIRFLSDGRRFILASSRTGWLNYYLYDLSGRMLAALTHNAFDAGEILRVDEASGLLYYMARDGGDYLKLQLHRVRLDGGDDRRLTDPAYLHAVDIAPDGLHFIDVAQTHDTPPESRLVDSDGKVLDVLAKSDMSKFHELNLRPVEMFTFKAADGKTDLNGMLSVPSDFDPAKKYPLLVTVYAGPETSGAREEFDLPNSLTELGFLVASLDSRSVGGRGKRLLDSIYEHLGTVEIDDQAAGVAFLDRRPYVDRNRVGIFGTSYGGYASAMCLLRHPDVFQAASASSPVTDWRRYDTIYTERYMWLPEENKAGYDAGSAITYASNLKGRLMLYFGTADDNVHPANTLELINALGFAGKGFDVQVGPDRGHSGLRTDRMMEFFIDSIGGGA